MKSFLVCVVLASCFPAMIAHAENIWGEKEWKKPEPKAAVQAAIPQEVDDARSLFDSIRHLDFKSPLAAEKLRRLGAERDEVKQALELYEKEKHGEYFEQLNVIDGSFFNQLKQQGSVAQYLLSALSQGNPISAVQGYFFSFMLDEQGLAQEAGYYFNKAEFMKRLAYERRFSHLVRPLQFELPDMYARLGMPRYSINQFQVVRFLDDEAMKAQRFLVENEVDAGNRHLNLGGFFHYDSNVIGIGNSGGTALLGFANAGIQTSPMQPINVGADFYSFINRHTRDDLGVFDTWTNIPSLWASAWNTSNNEIRLRYDYAHTLRDRTSMRFFSQTHGPQVGWAHLWDKKYQGEILYSYKRNFFAQDAGGNDQLSGPQHTFTLKISYPGASNVVQPFLRYSLDHNWPTGTHFQANTHAAEVGTAYLIGRRATLSFATGYSIAQYPHHEGGRLDKLRQVRLGGVYQVFDGISMFLDGSYLDNDSSIANAFSFRRWNVVLGPVFGVPL